MPPVGSSRRFSSRRKDDLPAPLEPTTATTSPAHTCTLTPRGPALEADRLSRAGDVFSDLISGQVQVYFGAMAASIEYIRAGRLRAVAVTTATRSAALPDLPTVGEFVPGYEWSSWYGIGAPKGTPADIVDTLNRAVNAGLADPKLKARFADLGAAVLAGTPADFGKLLAEETEKCAKVVRAANILPMPVVPGRICST